MQSLPSPRSGLSAARRKWGLARAYLLALALMAGCVAAMMLLATVLALDPEDEATAWTWAAPGIASAAALATTRWGRPSLVQLVLGGMGLVLVTVSVAFGLDDWRLESSFEVIAAYALPLTAGLAAIVTARRDRRLERQRQQSLSLLSLADRAPSADSAAEKTTLT